MVSLKIGVISKTDLLKISLYVYCKLSVARLPTPMLLNSPSHSVAAFKVPSSVN